MRMTIGIKLLLPYLKVLNLFLINWLSIKSNMLFNIDIFWLSSYARKSFHFIYRAAGQFNYK